MEGDRWGLYLVMPKGPSALQLPCQEHLSGGQCGITKKSFALLVEVRSLPNGGPSHKAHEIQKLFAHLYIRDNGIYFAGFLWGRKCVCNALLAVNAQLSFPFSLPPRTDSFRWGEEGP